MAYLDPNGNVNFTDPTQGQVGAQWQQFERQRQHLAAQHITMAAPASNLPSGAEKAERGHD